MFRNRLDDGDPLTTLPRLMVIDVPDHVLLMASRRSGAWPMDPGAAQWLAAYPPPAAYPLDELSPALAPEFAGGAAAAFVGGKTICLWPSGKIAHSGEGVLAFEVDIEVEGVPVRVHRCRVVSILRPQSIETAALVGGQLLEPGSACLIRFRHGKRPISGVRIRVENRAGDHTQSFEFPRLERGAPDNRIRAVAHIGLNSIRRPAASAPS